MMTKQWTMEEDALLLARVQKAGRDRRWALIAQGIEGRTAEACKKRYSRIKSPLDNERYLESSPFDEEEENELEGSVLEQWQEQVEKPSWEEILLHAESGADLQNRLRPIRTRATRKIKASEPIFLVFMADFHFGSPHTNYRAFLETAEVLRSNKNTYFVVAGPDLESAFTWFRDASAVLNQTIPPFMQLEAYKLWLDEMLPQCVAVCGDNHGDERMERYLGDIGLVWRTDVPYFRSWGILEIQVGKVSYEICMAHRFKGHSIYHDLQPVLRLFRDVYPLADAYVTAHTHRPAHLSGVFYPEARGAGKELQHFVITGTFKEGMDLYTLRNFGSRGVLGLPTLVLWPDRYKILHFDNPQDALEVMG